MRYAFLNLRIVGYFIKGLLKIQTNEIHWISYICRRGKIIEHILKTAINLLTNFLHKLC